MSTDCKNKIDLIGYVCSSPIQITNVQSGVKFKLATNEKKTKKNKDESSIISEYHTIKRFGKDAEYILQNIKVGDKLSVEGRMHYHQFKMEDGKIGINAEVIARHIINLSKNNVSNNDSKIIVPSEENISSE